MAKVNQLSETHATRSKAEAMNLSISSIENDSDTDFEFDEELDQIMLVQEVKATWMEQFQHLMEFSEKILPIVFQEPQKWCPVLIQSSMKHVAKTEEIVRNMGSDTRLLEMQLDVLKRHQQTTISKSRMSYNVHLYKYAGDVFFCAFHQNREILQDVRNKMESIFEAQFGRGRLEQSRSLLKLYFRQNSQIEDVLQLLPGFYQIEVLAGFICDYLNPLAKDERGVVEEKMKELLLSPDYQENQISLMLLAREECAFKQVILSCMMNFMIPTSQESASSNSTNFLTNQANSNSIEDVTRIRFKLFLDAEPDLLANACLATENLPMPLMHIIVHGLDIISFKITRKRLNIFEDFRPPLFGDDEVFSMDNRYYKFFQKMKEVPSTCSLLERVKNALKAKLESKKNINKGFWIELFVLLNDSRNKHDYDDSYYDLHKS